MADPNNKLPEGTDTIIGGAGSGGGTGGTGRSGTAGSAASTSTQTNATGGQTRTTDSSDATDALITGAGAGGTTGAASAGNSALGSSGTTGGTAGAGSTGSIGGTSGAASTGATSGTSGPDSSGDSGGGSGDNGNGGSSRSGVRGLVSSAGGKLRDEGKNKIHSLASQGLQQGSSTLTNIAGIVEDTVQQIEERLGPQYGEYARKASQAINGYATTLQNKNPDELVDDARGLIRKSPAVALTGAAVLGFGLARLLKIGLEESQYGTGNRNNDRTGTAG
jgi:hypothetical protein